LAVRRNLTRQVVKPTNNGYIDPMNNTQETTAILRENYYTLVNTGADAVEALMDDWLDGRFQHNLEDWNTTPDEMREIVMDFTAWLLAPERRNTPAMEFYR